MYDTRSMLTLKIKKMSEQLRLPYNNQSDEPEIPDRNVLAKFGISHTELRRERGINLEARDLKHKGPRTINIQTAVSLHQYPGGPELIGVLDVAKSAVGIVRVPKDDGTGYYDTLCITRAFGLEEGYGSEIVNHGEVRTFGRNGEEYGGRLGLNHNDEVSRHHFYIESTGENEFTISDKNSANGTNLITGVQDPRFFSNQTITELPAVR